MKHILIILSLLLLSSPVIGEETGVLYQYESSSGIQWKTFGNEKVQPKYEGEIKNGKMEHAYQSEQILMETFILGKKDTECCLVPMSLNPLLGK